MTDGSFANTNHRKFKPAWWLQNPHLQTLWAKLLRKQPKIKTHQERLELHDGDFLDLNFTAQQSGPIVLVLHGLEGSLQSKYASGILQTLHNSGYQAVFMHFRSCSGTINRLPRSYHSGDTADIQYVLSMLHQRYPDRLIAAIGFSLGGNALLKLLGETGDHTRLSAAVAVSVPFQLDNAANQLNRGFSKLYRTHLLRCLRDKIRQKEKIIDLSFLPLHKLDHMKDFWEFDDRITAPLHGFQNVHDYYSHSSCRQYLKNIRKTTLILHAADDPFMTPDAIPDEQELSKHILLELSPKGGHVGFVSGKTPWSCQYWLEHRIIAFLNTALKINTTTNHPPHGEQLPFAPNRPER